MGFRHTNVGVLGVAGLLLLGGGAVACGAGSELDDYADGIPDVVPVPESALPGAKGTVGSACAEEDTCKGDTSCTTSLSVLSLINIPLDGGYCSQACSGDGDCPSGSGCYTDAGRCLLKCSTDAECRVEEGYSCASTDLLGLSGNATTYCIPALDLGGLLGGGGAGGTGGLLGGLLGGGTGGTTGGTGGLLGGLFGGTGGTTGGTGGLFGGGTGGTTGGTGGLFGGGTGGTTGGTGGTGGLLGGLFGGGNGNVGLAAPTDTDVAPQ